MYLSLTFLNVLPSQIGIGGIGSMLGLFPFVRLERFGALSLTSGRTCNVDKNVE